ncbi:hypothetical protein D918_04078 [Trichuris suis]|nr:hypothetical protein D918_04078 [Trichuris suis]
MVMDRYMIGVAVAAMDDAALMKCAFDSSLFEEPPLILEIFTCAKRHELCVIFIADIGNGTVTSGLGQHVGIGMHIHFDVIVSSPLSTLLERTVGTTLFVLHKAMLSLRSSCKYANKLNDHFIGVEVFVKNLFAHRRGEKWMLLFQGNVD